MKYKLVEFIDGTWGVLVERPWWKFWVPKGFVDLISPRHTWEIGSEHFQDCKGNRQAAENLLKRKTASQYRVVES